MVKWGNIQALKIWASDGKKFEEPVKNFKINEKLSVVRRVLLQQFVIPIPPNVKSNARNTFNVANTHFAFPPFNTKPKTANRVWPNAVTLWFGHSQHVSKPITEQNLTKSVKSPTRDSMIVNVLDINAIELSIYQVRMSPDAPPI